MGEFRRTWVTAGELDHDHHHHHHGGDDHDRHQHDDHDHYHHVDNDNDGEDGGDAMIILFFSIEPSASARS